FGGELGLEMVRLIAETVVIRDQSYRATRWAYGQARAAVGRPGPEGPRGVTQGVSAGAAGSRITIRRAGLDDLPAITAIYNEAIRGTTATFDTEPKAVAERLPWFESHDERHPILVAEADGEVVGWASLSRWSERRAYDDTAETSF